MSQNELPKAAPVPEEEILQEGDEVWVRGEVNVLEDDDEWIEVSFESATGFQELSFKAKDIRRAAAPAEAEKREPTPGDVGFVGKQAPYQEASASTPASQPGVSERMVATLNGWLIQPDNFKIIAEHLNALASAVPQPAAAPAELKQFPSYERKPRHRREVGGARACR